MRLADLPLDGIEFRTTEDVTPLLTKACRDNADLATMRVIGASREGRPVHGIELGYGETLVTLMAGAHADEPVGPETLRTLVLEVLAHRDWLASEDGFVALLDRFTLRIIPHVNPDGEVRNRTWIEDWPDPAAFITRRQRERPGDDIEFGFPDMRPENRAATDFLFEDRAVAFHASLHGLAFGEGALLLLDEHWADRLPLLRTRWLEAIARAGLGVHDHDRGGDKGFRYLGPGFWTTPSGTAMRQHFLDQGDEETAALFHLSSMEAARSSGGHATTPLTLVTEVPLFVIGRGYDREPGVPHAYLELQRELPHLSALEPEAIREHLAAFDVYSVPLATAVRLQLRAIELALNEVAGHPTPA